MLMLELASNFEGRAGWADIALRADDGAGAGAVLRPRLDLGFVEDTSVLGAIGVLGVLGVGWLSG